MKQLFVRYRQLDEARLCTNINMQHLASGVHSVEVETQRWATERIKCFIKFFRISL